ncbi:MAG: DUF1318 domain-containing protein [Verrucomicrobia bacterium]|nr:DUF1318 domain-containing protein [Verrucomicrobiota bacterium]
MKTTLRLLALFSLAFFSLAARAVADEVGDAKQRIAARQSEVASLKTSGAVGENNRGLLEVRGGGGSSAKVVAEENRDRGILYAEAGKRSGVSADEAGRARAKQIAANSAPGVWVQKDDGTWQKK